MADFPLKAYNSSLDKMLEEGYEVMTFGRYLSLKNEKLPEKFIVLRHDVDKKPGNSLKTAEMESSKGISATYFFRMKDCSYDEGIVARIRDLGHEIGYHYEDLVLANGDKDKAIKHFAESLETMRKVASVQTICMHGSPLSGIDSKALWENYDYKEFGIAGDTFYDADYKSLFYITDTGRMWDGHLVSRRDNVPEQKEWIAKGYSYHSTFDVIKALGDGTFPYKAMMTTHPQRWTDNALAWFKELVMQSAKNIVKRAMNKGR